MSKPYKFSKEDKEQIEKMRKSVKEVQTQLEYFRKGFPYVNIAAAATPERGIKRLSSEQVDAFIKRYQDTLPDESVLKFVPASGAASRMFKQQLAFINSEEDGETLIKKDEYKDIAFLFENIEKFAFFKRLNVLCKKYNTDIHKDYKRVLELLLTEEGLNYGNLPKALLLFHKYEEENRTSAQEHFVEGMQYVGYKSKASLHFTVSEEHKELFEEHTALLSGKYSEEKNLAYYIKLSVQKQYTDTIAVDMENNPMRTPEGKLLFRPGGHGALIENLNDLKADIVFVKNIDNVVPDRLKPDTVRYKKALAGVLIEARNAVFDFMIRLEKGRDKELIEQAKNYLQETFCFKFPAAYETLSDKKKPKYLQSVLNRPVRVCGMVKNEGEPGGGPFVVKNDKGEESLQIVEMSQIDMSNPQQKALVDSATHFNPVDLVLSVRDYKGELFDLTQFIDPQTGFISEKSQNGKSLKALELPGLWNGAMAHWNTIFVEVPISTFNPVKVITDLLRETHIQ